MLPTHLAKYPFLPEAAAEVAKYGLSIEDLLLPEYSSVLERAVERISEAISTSPPSVSYRRDDPDVELLSFPVAVVLAASLGDDYVKRRYAVAEAKRVSRLLEEENADVVYMIAKRFGWRVRAVSFQIGSERFDFAVNFIDYLKAASHLIHESEWKLVNRLIYGGEVYLTKRDAARLIEEEVRRYVESRIEAASNIRVPSEIMKRLEPLKAIRAEKSGTFPEIVEISREVDPNSFPPCIKAIYEAVRAGRNVPHYGRFTLASFLLSVGMDVGAVIEVFHSTSDFRRGLKGIIINILSTSIIQTGKTLYKFLVTFGRSTAKIWSNGEDGRKILGHIRKTNVDFLVLFGNRLVFTAALSLSA